MDENTQELDVNEPEVETGGESSIPDQTTEETVETPEEAVEADPKSVPYDRFAEVVSDRNELKQTMSQVQQELSQLRQTQQSRQDAGQPADPAIMQQQAEAKQQLKSLLDEMGYVSKDELVRDRQDQALNSELSRLEKQYDGRNGMPKFDKQKVVDFAVKNGLPTPELAYEQMNKTAIINYHVQQAIAKSKGLKTEGSDGSGSANAGVTNDDLKSAVMDNPGDRNALHTLLKRAVRSSSSG